MNAILNFVYVGWICITNPVTVIHLARTKFMNSLPNDKILDGGKFKAFADIKIKSNKIMIFILDRIENIVGKGENAGYQHFLLFHNVFKRLISQGC